ncbi:UNVERIFIED_CONTAM: hypothetical protein HDU68_002243 [Siphonaria sp. JEL0065]|nr:hypothetical protein HDU68_002243 [Siphonaria sp. JEL0065]
MIQQPNLDVQQERMAPHPLFQIPGARHDVIPLATQTPTLKLTRHQIQLQMLVRMQAVAIAEGGSSGSESDTSSSDEEQQLLAFHQQTASTPHLKPHPQYLNTLPRIQSMNTYAVPQHPYILQHQQQSQPTRESPASAKMDIEVHTPSLGEFSTETETEFGTEFSFDEFLVDMED